MNVCDDKQVEEAVEVVNEYTDSLWAVVNNVSDPFPCFLPGTQANSVWLAHTRTHTPGWHQCWVFGGVDPSVYL